MCFWLQTILFLLSLPLSLTLQSELSHPVKPKSIQYCPKEGKCSGFVADMKGEQRILFIISLISIISAVWMNFKWFARSYLCYHRSNMNTILCSVLHCEWGGWVFEESWYVSDITTRWWSYSWFKNKADWRWRGDLQLLEDIRDLGDL